MFKLFKKRSSSKVNDEVKKDDGYYYHPRTFIICIKNKIQRDFYDYWFGYVCIRLVSDKIMSNVTYSFTYHEYLKPENATEDFFKEADKENHLGIISYPLPDTWVSQKNQDKLIEPGTLSTEMKKEEILKKFNSVLDTRYFEPVYITEIKK